MTRRAVILSSVRWNYMWQRHQAVATALHRLGYQVDFVEPHPRGLRHIAHWFGTKVRTWSVRGSARAAVHDTDGVDVWAWTERGWQARRAPADIVVIYLPSKLNLRRVRRLAPRLAIYDDVLDWSAAPPNWFAPRGWQSVVEYIADEARRGGFRVWTDSPAVARTWSDRGVVAQVLLPATDEAFRAFPWRSVDGRPVVLGYFGSVDNTKIDVEYLAAAAEIHEVRVIGEIDLASRRHLEGSRVEILPPTSLENLVREVDEWTDIVLPYRNNERSATLMPAKLLNALASRRRVHIANIDVPLDLREWVHDLPSDPRRINISSSRVAAARVPTWDQSIEYLIGDQVK